MLRASFPKSFDCKSVKVCTMKKLFKALLFIAATLSTLRASNPIPVEKDFFQALPAHVTQQIIDEIIRPTPFDGWQIGCLHVVSKQWQNFATECMRCTPYTIDMSMYSNDRIIIELEEKISSKKLSGLQYARWLRIRGECIWDVPEGVPYKPKNPASILALLKDLKLERLEIDNTKPFALATCFPVLRDDLFEGKLKDTTNIKPLEHIKILHIGRIESGGVLDDLIIRRRFYGRIIPSLPLLEELSIELECPDGAKKDMMHGLSMNPFLRKVTLRDWRGLKTKDYVYMKEKGIWNQSPNNPSNDLNEKMHAMLSGKSPYLWPIYEGRFPFIMDNGGLIDVGREEEFLMAGISGTI